MLPDPEKGEVTIKMIADAAGVAHSTVSRALQNHPRISQATIRRITRLADEMGYRRDAHLSDLMVRLRHRKKRPDRPVLALLLWQHLAYDIERLKNSDSIHGGLWRRAWACGYQPEFFNLAEFDNNRRRMSQILRTRGIRGGVLCPVERPAPLPDIPWDQLCIVATGYSVFSHHLHRCTPNHYQGMLDSLENLQRLGYRRIGLALAPTIHHRSHGYYHAAYLLSAAHAEQATLPPVFIGTPDGESAFRSWLKSWQPEVIICGGILRFVRQWLHNAGLCVPGDIGLADLQVIKGRSDESGIWQNPSEIGAGAIDLLNTLLERNETGLPAIARTLSVSGDWIEGNTTRRIARPPAPL
ncbi:MAG TPA: LacI family DNA-binding transcriptional regulator [Chthoniobacteraceae bacterium]|nr:LacI family DNA-binding transcriptional regulator [Chthoniobacteraceae bacterium]